MRNTLKMTGMVMTLLLLFGTVCSCTKTVTEPVITEHQSTIETVPKDAVLRDPVVFITGVDAASNNFYSNARNYFIEKEYEVIDEAFSLEEIINWLNKNYDERLYGEVHIVSHSNPWKGMRLETIVKGERTTVEHLQKQLLAGNIPTLKNVISPATKIVFHACGLGENTALLHLFKKVFTASNTPTIIASPFYTVFGKEFSSHYLAKPHYGFYPTAHSPGKVDLSKEFIRKYPSEEQIDWLTALYNKTERYIGEAYTLKFNIPASWEVDFNKSDQQPPIFSSQEELMDWIAEDELISKEFSNFNIPLEKFRWKSYVKDGKLIIKGKTTVVCILKPLIKPYGALEHMTPAIDNKRLYNSY